MKSRRQSRKQSRRQSQSRQLQKGGIWPFPEGSAYDPFEFIKRKVSPQPSYMPSFSAGRRSRKLSRRR